MEGGDMYTKIVFEEENLNSIVSTDLLWIRFCLQEVYLQSGQHLFHWLH